MGRATRACPREGGGRLGEQFGESREPVTKDRRERIRRTGDKMGALHPIGRIATLNRDNLVALRQIESASLSILARRSPTEHTDRYGKIRPCPGPDRGSVHAL